MSMRPYIKPQVVLNAGAMVGNLTSSPTFLQQVTKISYQASWTGSTPVGTMSIQGSNDYSLNQDGSVANSGTWTTLVLDVSGTPSTTVAVSGNTGDGIIDVETGINALRLIYTAGSGTGSLTVTVCGKVC